MPAIPCPAGTVITYQAKSQTTGYLQTENDIYQTFNTNAQQNNLAVRDYNVSTSFLDQLGSVVNPYIPFQFTATLQANVDFADVTDVQKICDHGLYMETNTMPVSSTPSVTLPGSAPQSTGQPSQGMAGTPTVHVCGDPSWGFLNDPGQWFTCAFQNTTNTFALVMVGVILAVILIIAGKQKGLGIL